MTTDSTPAPAANPWPALPLADWSPTRDTLTLWLQVVGKVALARTPLLNHWWGSTLLLTSNGLTTRLIPDRPGRSFTMELDLIEHRLAIRTTLGESRTMPLAPMPVSQFHAELLAHLEALDLGTEIWPMPVELPGAIPFHEDTGPAAYDAQAVTAFWRMLVETQRVFELFRERFVGKASPVHLYWGALDLAHTRFSGRDAPPHPGGAPNCGPHVMHEAYSHEVSSFGYWPGGDGEGIFYTYAYPDPPGYRDRPVGPHAHWDDALGEFVLPYTAIRTAADPDAVLLEFLQLGYEAAADTANWDRAALERPTD